MNIRSDPNWRVLVVPYGKFHWEWSVHHWAKRWTEVARGTAWTAKAAERKANSYLPSKIRNPHD